MKQIIHILKKDLRRFSFEIGLAFVLLALYTWSSPLIWLPPEEFFSNGSFLSYNEPDLLSTLLIMGWAILLVRLIQEESPAGDRQFWVTRPYQWPRLLLAKLFFILLVVSIPLLIAQVAMLAMAGFSPLRSIAALARLHLRFMWLVLPVAALAVISSGLMQLSRAAFMLLLFLAGIWWVDSIVPNLHAWHGSSGWDWPQYGVLVGVPLVVILLQYARRRTNLARLWLLGGAIAMLVLIAATPYRRLIEREYPPAARGETPIFQLQLSPVLQQRIHSNGKEVWISPELSAGRLAPGYVAVVQALQVSLEAPDGTRWDSGWHTGYNLLARDTFATTQPDHGEWQSLYLSRLSMDAKTFDRMKNVPLKAHVAVGVAVFREQEETVVAQTGGEFELPGVGLCSIQGRPVGVLWCRAPLRRPTLVGVTGRLFTKCPPLPAELATPPVRSTGWIVNSANAGEFDLSPVTRFIASRGSQRTNNTVLGACPGFPISYRQLQMDRKTRVEADFAEFKISTEQSAE